MTRNLNDKQKKFLEVLFTEAEGSTLKAKRMAGYSENTSVKDVVDPLLDEIAEATKRFIAYSSTEAAFAMVDIVKNPTNLGNKDKLAASKDLMDRAGFKGTEKVEVTAKNPLFILPPKEEE